MDVTADAVVVGGGLAGLGAAVRLADAGRRVVLVEAAPRLGGRASTFADPATGERVDNGQHVLFGCYRATFAFLKQIGTDRLAPIDRTLALSMVGTDGLERRLTCSRLPPPWHLLGGVLAWNALAFRDRVTVLKLAPALRRLRRPHGEARTHGADGAPGLQARGTVAEWLRLHGQSEALCRWLWHPLAIAALNQSAEVAAAGPFLQVLGELLGSRVEDSAIALPSVPLDELFALPATRYIEARGGSVLTGAPARVRLDPSGRIAGVRAGDASISTRVVVSAVPWHAVHGLWEGDCPAALAGLCADASRMQASPIVTVNIWFDRPVMGERGERLVGLIGGAMHWVFDKRALFGGGASHVSVVSSGASELAGMTNDRIARLALAELGRALAGARTARVIRTLVVRERRATFSLAPGQPLRPATTTPLPGLFLAGDWVDTGLPATIEGAVRSGNAAAERVLALTASS